MNLISAEMHKSAYATSPHPVLAIDGTPIELWIKCIAENASYEDDTFGLVPAQGWLLDENELNSAWKLLIPHKENSSTFVPLLICPDDVDLACTVIVVEQVVEKDKVIWARFGFAVEVINGIVTSVQWSKNEQKAEFDKSEFISACSELKRLTENEWV
ncbi:hypothetical protein [Undibacterium squillarum]|uniref:hypothetical protein n=1 Tax=Undibacterium squillarum TaxID=1131567 RepID=UPI0035AF320A